MDNGMKKPSKMWRIILVLSLALNVAVIGGAVGMAVTGGGHKGAPQRVMFDFGPISRVLDPADRRAIGEAMRKGGAPPPSRDEFVGKIKELADGLRADPFDPETVGDIIASFRVRSERVQQQAQSAFLDRLTKMTPQGRAALADRLEKGNRRKD